MSSLNMSKDKFSSLDYSTTSNNLSETFISGHTMLNDNYEPCFCTLNYQNKPVCLVHNSIDYIINYICLNYKINNLNHKAKILYDMLIELLVKEPVSELSSLVYSRWAVWICLYFGQIESTSWESKILIRLSTSETKLKDIANRHLKSYLHSSNVFCFDLVNKNISFETKIDESKVNDYLRNPRFFPDKHEFTVKTFNIDNFYKPEFNVSTLNKEIETKLIILDKLGKLGGSKIYNYNNFCFTSVEIESKQLYINFD
jgi:hypothetical protein